MRNPILPFFIALFWLFLLAASLLIAVQPVSLQAQFIIVGIILAIMFVLRYLRPTGFFRSAFIVLGSFVILRYIFWRTNNTIPLPGDSPAEIAQLVIGVILYIAEVYAILMFFISVFVSIDPMQRERVLLPADPSLLPTVDVYVPSLNEDEDLLRVTLMACRSMRYPSDRLRVYLLDDGGTDQKVNDSDLGIAHAARMRRQSLQQLCQGLGVTYLTRERNVEAKAGNLNAAFQRTSGDLIAIFDADHVPSEDFLEKTVGYFLEEPDLFLVQTPHFFINPDPVERNLNTYRRVPGEYEMFYGYIQRGLDKWNASFFCGSAALLKRTALNEVGGFSGRTLTEDAETALELHSAGYKSVYVDEPLVAGLQPETFVEFIRQRSRWAQGMMQIFLRKNPLAKPGLTFAQRLSYASSTMFWFFPFARLTFMLAPLFYLFFGLEIYRASAFQFVAYTVPYMIVTIWVSNYLYGRVRYPFFSELYEYVQSLFTIRALGSVMTGRRLTFNVTQKGVTQDEDSVTPLWVPFALMVGLLMAGVVATVVRWFYEAQTRDILIVVAIWNILNLIIALAGLGVVVEGAQRRRASRIAIRARATLQIGDRAVDALITDASIGGASLEVPVAQAARVDWKDPQTQLRVPFLDTGRLAEVDVKLRSVRTTANTVVIGVQFDPRNNQQMQDTVKLVYGNSQTWAEQLGNRRMAPGVTTGIFQFFGLAGSSVRRIYRHWQRRGRVEARQGFGRAAQPRAVFVGGRQEEGAWRPPADGTLPRR